MYATYGNEQSTKKLAVMPPNPSPDISGKSLLF